MNWLETYLTCMKFWTFTFAFLLLVYAAQAQEVLWANKVLGFSSEFQQEVVGQEFRAIQALGRPNKYPVAGESPCAWTPYNADSQGEEWIKVGFGVALRAKQVVVAENHNAGAITRVFAYTPNSTEVLIYEDHAPYAGKESARLLSIPIKDSTLVISAVKVVLNPARVRGYNQIDAVGISASTAKVPTGVNVSAKAPSEIIKENLGQAINSKGQEVAPIIAPDGKTLYFTRSKHELNMGGPEKQDVWFSKLESGNVWGAAMNMNTPINNAESNAICGIAGDGKTLYLLNVYKSDGTLIDGLSKSVRQKSGWSFPSECKITNNYNLQKDNLREYGMSPDGKILVLSVKRKDTFGKKDLYVSFQKKDKTWSEPQNMGADINTADEDGCPFVASDGQTVYFTSTGRPGFGDGDIFVSRRLDSTWTKWTEPENLGPAINTAGWDGYLTIPASGEYGYMSSTQNSMGETDIFRFKLYPEIKPQAVAIISGSVLNGSTKQPVGTDVITDLLKDNKEITKVEYNPETGEFKMIVPVGETYRLTAPTDGFFSQNKVIDLSREKRFREIRENITLVPVQAGQKIVLNNVAFEQSKFELVVGSEAELNEIVRLMEKNAGMEVLLEGHTDNQGDFKLNIKLSEDRVAEVKKYFVGKGIAETRVQTKGWGPTKPVASNESEDRRKLNRRVEFTILKM